MNLSLAMIANRMEDFCPEIHAYENKRDIKYLRIFDPDIPQKDQILDIGTSRQMLGDDSKKIVCRYGKDYMILNTENKDLAMNAILEIFRMYDLWTEKIEKLIKDGCTLTELLDVSSDIIQNPMLVLDSSDYMIAVSSKYISVEVDDHWFELLEKKTSAPEKIMAFHDSGNSFFDIKNRNVFYIAPGFFPRGSYSYNLYNESAWCGIFVIIEYLNKLNEGMIDDFKFLAKYIDQWIQQNTSADIFSASQALFTSIFSGQTDKISVLERKLLSKGWKIKDQKVLIKARSLSKNFHTDAYLCRIFNDASEYIYASPYNMHIIILVNLSGLSEDILFGILKQWFKKSRYFGGVSFPVNSLDHLKGCYEQAGIALNHGKKEAGELTPIRAAAIPYIIHTLSSCVTSDIIHPALERLAGYDQWHHTDYLNTLRIYLENDGSHYLTASLLHIHRNTLAQRLNRLKEEFGLDLDNPSECFYLRLSLYIRGNNP